MLHGNDYLETGPGDNIAVGDDLNFATELDTSKLDVMTQV